MRLSLILVTFDSVQSAQRAKASLNGADIYSGCCTLKIEYAKVSLEVMIRWLVIFQVSWAWLILSFVLYLQPTRLNVFKNDQDTWDYTNPNLSGQGNPDDYFVLHTPALLLLG